MRDEELASELENRLIDFGVRIIRVADALPRTPAGRHLGGQILRCGTSPAPHYAEARGAESRPDFIHKLRIALKELNETSVWLRMICRSALLKSERLESLIEENIQLCKILSSSISTARQNGQKRSSNDTPPEPPGPTDGQ